MKRALSLSVVAASLLVGGAVLADEPAAPPVAAPPAPEPAAASGIGGGTAAPREAEVDYGGKEPGDTQRLFGGLVGGSGFITGAVGLFLVISSTTLYSEAKSRCHSAPLCSADEVSDANKARSRANGGGIVMVVGAAVLGGGIALYFTAPRAKKTVALAPSLGGFSLQGSF